MNGKIQEFDPQLYPTRIWVGVNVPYKEVSEKFYSILSDGSLDDFSEDVENRECQRSQLAIQFEIRKADGVVYSAILSVQNWQEWVLWLTKLNI